MKKCKFCDTVNSNEAQNCSSCGANSFINICDNCGSEVASGGFCSNCGVKLGTQPKVCPKCGKKYFSVACPDCGYIPSNNNQAVTIKVAPTKSKKENHSGWWYVGLILLWMCFLPIMLTIVIWKSEKLSKKAKWIITAIIWIISIPIYLSDNNAAEETDKTDSRGITFASEKAEMDNEEIFTTYITEIEMNKDNLSVKVGETKKEPYSGYAHITYNKYKRNNFLDPDDVNFISTNTDVATIELDEDRTGSCYYAYYKLTSISPGETEIYAVSSDGVESNHCKVVVPDPILIEELEVSIGKNIIVSGEILRPKVSFSPYDADNTDLIWTSSDETIAVVNNEGVVSPVESGNATITVSTSTGITSQFDITVDTTKTLVDLSVKYDRQDNASIGLSVKFK